MSRAAIDATATKPRRARASEPRESLVMTLPCGAGTVRRGAYWLFELVGDLVEPRLDAGLVLLAAGSAGDAGRADHVFAGLDRQCAARGGEAGEILRAHLRILLQAVFHLARRDTERARREGLLEAVLHGVRPGPIATDLHDDLAVAPDDRGRHLIAVRLAGRDGGFRDGEGRGSRQVLAGEELRARRRHQNAGETDAGQAIQHHRHDGILPS